MLSFPSLPSMEQHVLTRTPYPCMRVETKPTDAGQGPCCVVRCRTPLPRSVLVSLTRTQGSSPACYPCC